MPSLIADIGGTNARFALVADGGTEASEPMVFACADFASPADAALAYLQRLRPEPRPWRGAFAIASPVTGDRVEMTNHIWRFSVEETRNRLGLEQLEVVNDFTAVALAVPYLTPADRVTVGGHAAIDGMPMAVIGPGTGLGVSALLPSGGGWLPIPSEGGHITMPAADEREAKVIAWLRSRRGHVSAERVLSGPGLVNLYTALRGLLGLDEEPLTPAQLTDMAASGDPLAREAMAMFFAMLGTVAGNLALTLGAKGGVVIAGGIVPRHLPAFLASDFRQRFDDKGRFRSWLEPIPVHVAIHPFPAFLGLANLLNNPASS